MGLCTVCMKSSEAPAHHRANGMLGESGFSSSVFIFVVTQSAAHHVGDCPPLRLGTLFDLALRRRVDVSPDKLTTLS